MKKILVFYMQFSAIFWQGLDPEPNFDKILEFLGKFYMGFIILKIINPVSRV